MLSGTSPWLPPRLAGRCAENRGSCLFDLPLGHHLDQVAQAELEAQVPSHAQNDDFAINVAICEQLLPTLRLPLPTRSSSRAQAYRISNRYLHQNPKRQR
jgi:hypothetical protein